MNVMGRNYGICEYSKKQIIEMCKEIDISQLYNLDAVNYLSAVKEDTELCNEVVAEWVLKNIKKIKKIKMFISNKSYFVSSHNGILTSNERLNPSNREEEILAKNMHRRYYEPIGEIIDYQIPLKDYLKENKDSHLGKIDLLSVNENTKKIHIIELKKFGSKETMLRCILEGLTYYYNLNKSKLKEDYAWKFRKEIKEGLREDISDYDFVVTPLVFKESQAFVEMMEMHNGYRDNLQKLMDSLGNIIELYYLDGKDEKAICHHFSEIWDYS